MSMLSTIILRGARRAYELDNRGGPPFEEWLHQLQCNSFVGDRRIVRELHTCCDRAIRSCQRPFSSQPADDQEAVRTAEQALSAVMRLWCLAGAKDAEDEVDRLLASLDDN